MRIFGNKTLRKWCFPAILVAVALSASVAAAAGQAAPAALLSVESFRRVARNETYAGAGLFAGEESVSPEIQSFAVRWWAAANPADKRGLIILFSYVGENLPSRVRDISRPLSERLEGNQIAHFEIPPEEGRVVAWRALLLQRGRPLSILKSPDWSSNP